MFTSYISWARVAAVLLFFLFAARVQAQVNIPYATVKEELSLPKDNSAGVLVFIVNTQSDCAMCNIKTYSIWNDPVIQQIPHDNKVLLMRDIRKVERKFYEQRFSYMETPVKIITSSKLYDKYKQLIPHTSPQGGVVLFRTGAAPCIYPFNTPQPYSTLIDCFVSGGTVGD